ncbi:unnamed protein product [Boreogadus saida]
MCHTKPRSCYPAPATRPLHSTLPSALAASYISVTTAFSGRSQPKLQESPITDHHHKRGVSWLDEGTRGGGQLRNGGRRIEEGVPCCEAAVGVKGDA